MSYPIYSKICKINEVLSQVKQIWMEKYNLSEIHADKIIDKNLEPYFNKLRDDLYAIIEHPYIDKLYRDTYYSYYSSKLENYYRDSIRISFFEGKIETEDFFSIEHKTKIKDEKSYLGFLTLRPTFPKIIGRTALSPKAKKENEILCCLAKINSTANFVKYKVHCFPHSSQDGQTISCAETTIWSLLEYFGNKYPEYKPVLPSTIHKTLQKYSFKRLTPSEGLTAQQVTFAVRELGFGAMIYSRNKYVDTFDTIISTYIESGIPVIAVLTDEKKKLGHAVNIIGREREAPERVMNANVTLLEIDEKTNIEIIDYNKVDRRYVFIDDNHPPYQLANLAKPFKEYYKEERYHDCSISNIIVPLYPKIYLDAVRARHNFYQYLKNKDIGIIDAETRIVKIFLASSRSYKEYISLSKNLDGKIKVLFLGIAMPKFIWVAEISKKSSFQKNLCDGFILQDATEPIKQTDSSMLNNLSLIAGYVDDKYFTQYFENFKKVTTFAASFENYRSNLQ